jgi:very-short-patch-repair endonuclease
MPVQQRLVRADAVARELDRVKRHRFRRALIEAIGDIGGGAESLNEIDFARECRIRGLPEPSRQVLRRTPQGRIYLDVRWDRYGVVVEVNGAGHARLDVAMRDEVRVADLQTSGDAVVPLSVLTLRADPDPVFTAIRRLLRSRGWKP